jgi:hypothetical protein
MIIYSHRLKKYILEKILPRILVLPNMDRVKIVGNFQKKIVYVTDIDLDNYVYPEYDSTSIYSRLLELLGQVEKYSDIRFLYIIAGDDKRFKLENIENEQIERVRSLLQPRELSNFDRILGENHDNPEKCLYLLNKYLKKLDLITIRWTMDEIMTGQKILRGDQLVRFKDIISLNKVIIITYYIKYESDVIGIDMGVIYHDISSKSIYSDFTRYILVARRYSQEYYFVLYRMLYEFRRNPKIWNEVHYLVEIKFGLYKYLIVRINLYHKIYKYGHMDLQLANNIVVNLLRDLDYLHDFRSNIPQKIREVAQNVPPEERLVQWDILLQTLKEELEATVNRLAKPYYEYYLELLSKKILV